MIAGRRFRRSIPVVLAAFLTMSVWLHRGITLERFML